MIPLTEQSIGFLCAFECGPKVAYLLTGCEDRELRQQFMKWIAVRVEWTCQQLDGTEGVDPNGPTIERMSMLSYFAGAALVDLSRERDNLRSALQILETILAERGDR